MDPETQCYIIIDLPEPESLIQHKHDKLARTTTTTNDHTTTMTTTTTTTTITHNHDHDHTQLTTRTRTMTTHVCIQYIVYSMLNIDYSVLIRHVLTSTRDSNPRLLTVREPAKSLQSRVKTRTRESGKPATRCKGAGFPRGRYGFRFLTHGLPVIFPNLRCCRLTRGH